MVREKREGKGRERAGHGDGGAYNLHAPSCFAASSALSYNWYDRRRAGVKTSEPMVWEEGRV